jgi:hypothetical protein
LPRFRDLPTRLAPRSFAPSGSCPPWAWLLLGFQYLWLHESGVGNTRTAPQGIGHLWEPRAQGTLSGIFPPSLLLTGIAILDTLPHSTFCSMRSPCGAKSPATASAAEFAPQAPFPVFRPPLLQQFLDLPLLSFHVLGLSRSLVRPPPELLPRDVAINEVRPPPGPAPPWDSPRYFPQACSKSGLPGTPRGHATLNVPQHSCFMTNWGLPSPGLPNRRLAMDGICTP